MQEHKETARPGPRSHSRDVGSREQLLRAGKTLFARVGIDGTTVRDIARLAGVNSCMVSYHFDGKEGLYRACIEEFGHSRIQDAKALLEPVRSAEEFRIRLRLLIQNMAGSQAEDPEMHKILARECERGLPVAKAVYEATFLKLQRSLVDFLKGAQKVGILRAELDPVFFASMIYGTVANALRMDFVNRTYWSRSILNPAQRETLIETMLSVILDSALEKRPGRKG